MAPEIAVAHGITLLLDRPAFAVLKNTLYKFPFVKRWMRRRTPQPTMTLINRLVTGSSFPRASMGRTPETKHMNAGSQDSTCCMQKCLIVANRKTFHNKRQCASGRHMQRPIARSKFQCLEPATLDKSERQRPWNERTVWGIDPKNQRKTGGNA